MCIELVMPSSHLVPSPWYLPNPGIEPESNTPQVDSLPTELPGTTREVPSCWISYLWVLNCRQNMLCEHQNIEPKSTGTEFCKCPKMVADGPRVLSPSPTWEARWPVKVLGIVSLHVAPDPLLPRPCAACPWLWLSSEQNSEIKEALPLHRT